MQARDPRMDSVSEKAPDSSAASASLAWALLLTGIVVMLLALAFVMNVGRAVSLAKLPDARHWLAAGGVVLVLFGAAVAAFAIVDIRRSGRWIARLAVTWLWTSAVCVGIGALLDAHHRHAWSWLELGLGVLASLVITAAVNWRHRQRRVGDARFLPAADH